MAPAPITNAVRITLPSGLTVITAPNPAKPAIFDKLAKDTRPNIAETGDARIVAVGGGYLAAQSDKAMRLEVWIGGEATTYDIPATTAPTSAAPAGVAEGDYVYPVKGEARLRCVGGKLVAAPEPTA